MGRHTGNQSQCASTFLNEEQQRIRRCIAWFVLAACGVTYAQMQDVDANEKVVRAVRTFNKAQVLYQLYGKEFPCRLEQLGKPRNGAKPSAEAGANRRGTRIR
jgi:hypothetical protein